MVRKDRDAKAELNRRGQACDVLAGTGIRVAEMVGHEGIAPSILVWKTSVFLSTLMPGRNCCQNEMDEIGIPCWSCTSLYGSAGRRLSCSANGKNLHRQSCYEDLPLR
jgi:hypothetical protein